MSQLASKFFNYRSYTPIPFVLVMLFFAYPNIWSLISGFIIAVIGELIRLWGVSWAGSETRTTGTVGGTYLIVSGPFAHLRNPLYLGNILMYTGFRNYVFCTLPLAADCRVYLFFDSILYDCSGRGKISPTNFWKRIPGL